MAAIVVADEHDQDLRRAVANCRARLGTPPGKPLHWNQHVKTFSRRRYVAEQLRLVPTLALHYIVFHKAQIPAYSVMRQDQAMFYNYVAGITLERILLAAKSWGGGPRRVVTRFGHVRGFNHQDTLDYFARKEQLDGWLPWSLLSGEPRFVHMDRLDGLQAADQYAGMLHCALVPDALGFHEEHHLLTVRAQIRRRYDGSADGYGWKVMPRTGAVDALPWWPVGGI